LPGILAPLSDPLTLVAVPRPRLLHDVVVHRDIKQIPFPRNPLTVQNIELGFAERSSYLVFYNFDAGTGAGYYIAFFDSGDAADVDAN